MLRKVLWNILVCEKRRHLAQASVRNHEQRAQVEASSAVDHRTAAVSRATGAGSGNNSNKIFPVHLPSRKPKSTAPYTQTCKHVKLTKGQKLQTVTGTWSLWQPQAPDHRKETQTPVVWTCPPFIRSGQNHLARHSQRGNKTRQTDKEVGRQHQGMDRPGVRQVPEGSG